MHHQLLSSHRTIQQDRALLVQVDSRVTLFDIITVLAHKFPKHIYYTLEGGRWRGGGGGKKEKCHERELMYY
jgi:hypothetical protein